ncbi:MAG: hypothetical protein ACI8R4_002852 [Paracoccaceae bacterium]|jgi:hypothetical protein
MNTLMQVSLFSEDFIGLSEFRRTIFDLTENEVLRSDVFRGYMAGQVMVGFSALAAYEMSGLDPRKKATGIRPPLPSRSKPKRMSTGLSKWHRVRARQS